jgi:hypothetical protein
MVLSIGLEYKKDIVMAGLKYKNNLRSAILDTKQVLPRFQ